MKKIYLVLFCALGLAMAAQPLSGVYTIDDSQPVSATNFTSFTQFAAALSANGVNGPVTVNVGGAAVYTEQVNFNQYTGASATNSVVVNGNGRVLTFNSSSTTNRHTLMLSGADYMTFNDLTVRGTNATNALVVHLWNGADHNTFNNCLFEAPFNGTATTQVPFSVSGSSVAATTAGRSGSYNTVNSCTMVGGYYSTVFYGYNGTPADVNNEVRNSVIRDFYSYGFYNLYCLGTKAIGNVVERLNRTTVTTTYAMYLSTGSIADGLIEGNHVRNLYNGINNNSSATYCIYLIADATASAPNIVRNNVISDINNNGTLYGIYISGAAFTYAYHNTIAFDDPNATAGTCYGIYCTGPDSKVINNNVTLRRAGSGTRYGLYYTTAATNLISDHNNVFVGGVASFGYYGAAFANLAAWQTGTGFDMNTTSADPQYASPVSFDYAPTNIAVNNVGTPMGLLYDFNLASRSVLTPDPGAYEIFNSPCSTAPPTNSFVTPTGSVCPGAQIELTLQHSNTYTNSGYEVQWYASTVSSVGGYSAIPGATLNSYFTDPIMGTIHYQAVVTCTNNNQSSITPPGTIYMSALVQDTVPYHEGFEVIGQNGLPNCYWSSTNGGNNTFQSTTINSGNRVPRNGNGYAYFQAPGTNYFFTNQILLKTGITYSAAVWYITENFNVSEWTELSILVGQSQTTNGLQQVASISPVTGQLYNLLSDTFKVNTTGYYYVAVRATPAGGSSQYLSIDDLSITIPCSLNSPTLSMIAPTSSVCQGVPVNLLASGANTYSWSNGVFGSVNTVAPITNSTYVVYGKNSLSQCTSTMAVNVGIKPAPNVAAFASSYSVCFGGTTTLSAVGADNMYWSTGATSSVIVVTPSANTTYVVAGTNSLGCTSSSQVQIQVNPVPIISAVASGTMLCRGDIIDLQAMGGDSYLWTGPQLYSNEALVKIAPQSSAVYTLTGTNQQGCSSVAQITVAVQECLGIAENGGAAFKLYPNPAGDNLYVEAGAGAKNIIITDVAGRVIMQRAADSPVLNFDLSKLSAGVYYVQLHSADYSRTEKFIKQ